MIGAVSSLLPLHAGPDDWHGWLSQVAVIAIVGGVWLGLTGVAERRDGRGRGRLDRESDADAKDGARRGAEGWPFRGHNPE